MAEWFLFIFVLDIKIYFLFQYLRSCPFSEKCLDASPLYDSSKDPLTRVIHCFF
ncbi:unnamed protein product [Oikopleura dioica]|uniref:Uncharacterized protein n=2 Tax=Oikopleura dioica TaxID=34765 RepID=E4XIV3_OIKDI|nr:unnamed protein product [Oikopleura dioica]